MRGEVGNHNFCVRGTRPRGLCVSNGFREVSVKPCAYSSGAEVGGRDCATPSSWVTTARLSACHAVLENSGTARPACDGHPGWLLCWTEGGRRGEGRGEGGGEGVGGGGERVGKGGGGGEEGGDWRRINTGQ